MDVKTLQNRSYNGVPLVRRRKRKRSLWRRTFLPIIKICVVACLAVFAVGLTFVVANATVSRVSRPIKLLNSEYQETQRVHSQLGSIKQENAVLQSRINHLKSLRGAERAARKLGYVKPGEIILVIPE